MSTVLLLLLLMELRSLEGLALGAAVLESEEEAETEKEEEEEEEDGDEEVFFLTGLFFKLPFFFIVVEPASEVEEPPAEGLDGARPPLALGDARLRRGAREEEEEEERVEEKSICWEREDRG